MSYLCRIPPVKIHFLSSVLIAVCNDQSLLNEIDLTRSLRHWLVSRLSDNTFFYRIVTSPRVLRDRQDCNHMAYF